METAGPHQEVFDVAKRVNQPPESAVIQHPCKWINDLLQKFATEERFQVTCFQEVISALLKIYQPVVEMTSATWAKRFEEGLPLVANTYEKLAPVSGEWGALFAQLRPNQTRKFFNDTYLPLLKKGTDNNTYFLLNNAAALLNLKSAVEGQFKNSEHIPECQQIEDVVLLLLYALHLADFAKISLSLRETGLKFFNQASAIFTKLEIPTDLKTEYTEKSEAVVKSISDFLETAPNPFGGITTTEEQELKRKAETKQEEEKHRVEPELKQEQKESSDSKSEQDASVYTTDNPVFNTKTLEEKAAAQKPNDRITMYIKALDDRSCSIQ